MWICLDGEGAGHDCVNPVAKRVKLLVSTTQDVVLEQVTRPAVEFKQSHVQLHGEICKHT